MLLATLYILEQVGTTDYEVLLTFSFSEIEQKFLWFAFFLSFASKVPMVPVHLWLPEAHVEAPTAGSVILAGVLLKLGTYGFIRFSLPLFPQASFFFAPLVYTISAVGIVYTSFTAIRQTDFKRVIAYTSIAHMNLVMLGIFSFNTIGIEGAIFQSLSHGFVASALFLLIGVVYDRYRTRLVQYYGGLASTMPIYVFIFLFFTMANIGLPGTSSVRAQCEQRGIFLEKNSKIDLLFRRAWVYLINLDFNIGNRFVQRRLLDLLRLFHIPKLRGIGSCVFFVKSTVNRGILFKKLSWKIVTFLLFGKRLRSSIFKWFFEGSLIIVSTETWMSDLSLL